MVFVLREHSEKFISRNPEMAGEIVNPLSPVFFREFYYVFTVILNDLEHLNHLYSRIGIIFLSLYYLHLTVMKNVKSHVNISIKLLFHVLCFLPSTFIKLTTYEFR